MQGLPQFVQQIVIGEQIFFPLAPVKFCQSIAGGLLAQGDQSLIAESRPLFMADTDLPAEMKKRVHRGQAVFLCCSGQAVGGKLPEIFRNHALINRLFPAESVHLGEPERYFFRAVRFFIQPRVFQQQAMHLLPRQGPGAANSGQGPGDLIFRPGQPASGNPLQHSGVNCRQQKQAGPHFFDKKEKPVRQNFFGRQGGKGGRETIHLQPPEIRGYLLQQLVKIRHQLRIHEGAAFQGIFLQHALAEGVDGENGRLVKILQGADETPPGLVMVVDLGQQAGFKIIPAPARGKGLQTAAHHLPHPQPQILRGGPGVGHHQNLPDRQLLFQQQPDKKAGNGVCFARAGAGLDEMHAGQGIAQQGGHILPVAGSRKG